MNIEKVITADKFSDITDYWNPRIAGELNGQQVKLVKFKGEFTWHKHDNEDEMFYVIQGQFDMHFRDKTVTLKQNEFLIVPKGTEHCPVAENEVSVMLIEPAGTLNTGNIRSELTRDTLNII